MRNECFKVQPIETGGIAIGVPDLFFAKEGLSGWIELKNIQGELPDTIRIDFRPRQFSWLMEYMEQKVNVYLGISCEEGIFFFKNNDIHKEYEKEEFLKHPHINKMRNIQSYL
jgi:hypothetical protein